MKAAFCAVSFTVLALLGSEVDAQQPDGIVLTLQMPVTEGPSPPGDVSAAFEGHLEALRACYTTDPKPPALGALHLFFFVGASGQVFKAEVASSSLGRPAIETCVKRQLLTWRLPTPSRPEVTTADAIILSSLPPNSP